MKSLMKKSLALVLMCAVAFGCMCIGASAASADPTVAVSKSSVAAKAGESASAKITFTNIGAVAGMQFKVSYDASALTFDADTFNADLQSIFKNSKAVDNGGSVSVVAVNSGKAVAELYLPFTVKADAAVGTKEFKVSDLLMVDNGENAIKNCKTIDGSIVINRADTTTVPVTEDKSENLDDTDSFVPFGSAYDDAGNYYKKNADGSFELKAGDVKVDKFKKPDASLGFTTFGTSENILAENEGAKKDGYVQFGTYVDSVTAKTYGTLLMVGDFNAFAEYYRAKGYTDNQVVNSIYKTYSNNSDKWGTDGGLTINGKNGVSLAVYAVKSNTYMWKNSDASSFQYALRVKTEAGKQYYAVGYGIKDDNSVIFSAEIQNYNK